MKDQDSKLKEMSFQNEDIIEFFKDLNIDENDAGNACRFIEIENQRKDEIIKSNHQNILKKELW